MFRVCSEYVQGWLSRLVVKIVVIALSSASSVSVFGIFSVTLDKHGSRTQRISSRTCSGRPCCTAHRSICVPKSGFGGFCKESVYLSDKKILQCNGEEEIMLITFTQNSSEQ